MVLRNYISYSIFLYSILLISCNGPEKNNELKAESLLEDTIVSSIDTIKPVEEIEQKPDENEVFEKVDEKEEEKTEVKPKKEMKEEPVVVKIEPPVTSTKKEKETKPKITSASGCPESIRPYMDFDNKYGILSCEMNPENTSYHYYLVISKNSSFNSSSIVKSFDLNFNSIFPVNADQKEQLKRIKEYANLYFRYEIYCDKNKYQSQVIGPLSISCRDSGECQIMR
ncbi:MAG: hypothetical protein ACKVQB_04625 [Bacteroidia bacterium]